MKSGPLSDEKVIATINEHFVPFIHNVSDPSERSRMPALRPWEKCYETSWTYRLGFTVSVVVSPDGKVPIASTDMARGHWWQLASSPNFVGEKYRTFLEEARGQFEQLRAVAEDPKRSPAEREAELRRLHEEITARLREVNTDEKKPPARRSE